MSSSVDPIPPPTVPPAVPLDYGHEDRAGDFGRKVSGAVADRVNGFSEFIGMLIGLVGGGRQILFAAGIACVAVGVTIAIQREHYNDAPAWIGTGAFLIGLVVPIPRRRTG